MNSRFNIDLGKRLREIRTELCGEYGAQFLADSLGIVLGTWMNYENGVVVPAEVILGVIEVTGANPRWLLSGDGDKFVPSTPRAVSRSIAEE